MFTIFDKELKTMLFSLGNSKYIVLYVSDSLVWQIGKLLKLRCYKYDCNVDIESEDLIVVK